MKKNLKKVTIITPTYNDGETIEKTLETVRKQTYKNWEHIIINDGSTDDTENIIKKYKAKYDKENKIKYIYQENADQLNAIINGMQYITGDYVYTLHSDDFIPSETFIEEAVNEISRDSNTDAIIGDFLIMNDNDEVVNKWKALKYRKKDHILPIVLLNYGTNIYGDVSMQTKENFYGNTLRNYLTWNTPFWINLDEYKQINVKNVTFPMYKYRLNDQNYICNEIGKFNALNGELRTLTRLMKVYDIPMFSLQRGILSFLRMRGVGRLRLTPYYHPIYFKREQRNKAKILEKVIKHTYKDGYESNEFLTSLVSFYKNINNEKVLKLNEIKTEEIYLGKDIRIFTKKLFAKELPKIYYKVFKAMKSGFKIIEVNTEEEKVDAINLTKFLCIYPYVDVKVKGE